MVGLVVRRIVIFLFLGITLITLEITTEESLLSNLPSYEDVLASLQEKREQEQKIIDEINNTDGVISEREFQEQEYEKLFDHSVRHTFVIEFTRSEFNGLIDDMESYNEMFGSYKSNNYRRVDVTYIADEEVQTFREVGFRSKGNVYSRRLPIADNGKAREIHFMLKFNETFDYFEGSPTYQELKTREVFNLEQLLFKWNNQFDASYSNEIYSYEMFQKIGVVVPEASYTEVRIVIDGVVEMVSFYNVFEQYDEEFVRKHLQEVPTKEVGDLYKAAWSANFDVITDPSIIGVRDWENNYRPLYGKETNQDDINYDNLIEFTYGLNLYDLEQRKAFLETHFNIDSFLRATAMNVLLGNPDDYRGNTNNFYFYIDENDYLTFIPFDYDNSMGAGWNGFPAFIDFTLGNDIYEWGTFDFSPGIPLIDNIFDYEEYKIIYENYLMEFINDGTYSVESYNELYDVAYRLYGDLFQMSNNKDIFINAKIDKVTSDVAYYRSLRNN
ncbi:MAG: CotH kinase family protein [Bacilli bacterium]|nr:CotH kinase family protein [Bacilli bacterium]